MELSIAEKYNCSHQLATLIPPVTLAVIEQACEELKSMGYTTANRYDGEAAQALSAALGETSDNYLMLPEITVFLPNARFVPPDPDTSFTIRIKTFTDNKGVERIRDVVLLYQNKGLSETVTKVADVLLKSLDTIFPP